MTQLISKSNCLHAILGLLILLLISACTTTATCNNPYIPVGTDCCLDQNNNSICDTNEKSQSYDIQNTLVTEVVDGDTITVAGGTRIRLIGIDAPESNEPYYNEAKEYLEEKVLNTKVKLEKDITDKDQYSRSLRYVWLGEALINAEIVRSGWAIAKQYEPDINYQDAIAQAEQQAIKKQIGIWAPKIVNEPQETEPEIISYLDANNYIGQTKAVEGTIVRTFKYTKGNIIFLNFHDPYEGYFTAIIWKDNWNKFLITPELYYKSKKVRITGEIINYQGSPEIIVSDPLQIKII